MSKKPNFEELLARSSLGTPGAVALRKKADPKIVQKILDRVDELERNGGGETDQGARLGVVDLAALAVSLDEEEDEIMAGMKDQKELQREEETELLEELVSTKLDAVFQEVKLLGRTLSLNHEEVLGVVGDGFSRFATGLAIEGDESKLEFLKGIAEIFDELMEPEPGDDEDTDLKLAKKNDDGPVPS